jgi:heme/copper-type cytochrome/quinol oxidase subunit 1
MSAYNLIASIGSFVLAIGIILTLVNAAASYNNGTPAGPDAWHGSTLEWFAPSPPPIHNFDLVPDVRSNEPYRDIRVAVRRRETTLVLPGATIPAAPEPEAEPAVVGAEAAEETYEQPVTEAEPPAGEDAKPEGDEPGEQDGPLA